MTAAQLDSVFLTGDDKSILLKRMTDSGVRICSVILPYRAKNEIRLEPMLKAAKRLSIPIFRPRRTELSATLKKLRPIVLFSAGYPYLLDTEALSVAQFNLNLHPTILPKYRGPATSWHIIANGENESGVTVHFMDESMDGGPIVCQIRVPVTPFDTTASLQRKTREIEPEAALVAFDMLKTGKIKGRTQNSDEATIFPEFRKPEDSQIDPDCSLIELFNFVRACDPKRFPAFFEHQGEKVGIKLFRLDKPVDEEDLI